MKKNKNTHVDWGLSKLIKVMKLTILLLFVLTFQTFASSYAQSTRLNLLMKDATFKDFIKKVEAETDFYFMLRYDEDILDKHIDLNYKNAQISEILDDILAGTGYSYKIIDKYIAITKTDKNSDNMQQKQISGTVTDQLNKPLPGVTVVIKGTTHGTTTDDKGKFTLVDVPDDAILVFSFVGMKAQEVAISGKKEINVVLDQETIGLEEVVAVGYGTQKKVNLTGAIAQIDANTLKDRPLPNMTQLIQGTVPNLNVDFSNGRPGKDASINIRGNTSINGGGPLVLIDGIPGSINRVNPRDVKSVTVLKDAAASAIYGARGAFGVILVTTKTVKNKNGDISISYGNNFGWSTPTVKTDFITTGYDWALLNDEAFKIATGNTYTRYTDADMAELEKRRYDKTENPERPWIVIDNRKGKDQYVYYGNFDWYNYLFNTWQPSQEHNVNVSGGTDKLNFLVSGRYYKKDGIMKLHQDKFDFYSFRSKVNAKVNNWLTLSNNTQFNAKGYSYFGAEGGEKANFNSFAFHGAASYMPVNPDGTATGRTGLNSYWITGGGIAGNYLAGKSRGANNNYEFTSTVEATIKISKSINVIGNYSYNMYLSENYYRSAPSYYSLYPGVLQLSKTNSTDQLRENSSFDQYYVANVYGNYKHTFGNHSVHVMVGYNQERKTYKSNSETKNNLISQDLNAFNLATGDMTVNGGASEWDIMGVFSRINYDYKGKYLFEMDGRYDGTSRFPKGDRFGFFPSFSAGWRLSEEGFFSSLRNSINNLKLRASYGSLGNQQVATYAYISSMGTNTMNYIMDGAQTQYTRIPAPVSASLTWEKLATSNVGIDVDFFNSRLSASFDTYVRTTQNMLTKGKTLPAVFGATEPKENAADLETKGFEFSVGWKDRFDLASDPFSYNISFILSDYHAKITKYDNPSNLLSDYYVGEELGEMWGYIIDGYFASDEEAASYDVDQTRVNNRIRKAPGEWGQVRAGDLKFRDLNDDGKIDDGQNTLDDHGDLVKIGNSQPRYAFGINMGGNWKGFDVSMFLQGIGKKDWYPGNESDKFWGPYSRPYMTFTPSDFANKVWSEDNPNSYFPRLRAYTAHDANSEMRVWNNRYLQNLAYLRVKNLTLGYSFSSILLNKLKIDKFRIYVSGENLFTFTKLDSKYIDPEQVTRNQDTRDYPFSKTYSVGLDITF